MPTKKTKRLHRLSKYASRSHFLRTDGHASLPFMQLINIFSKIFTILQPRSNTAIKLFSSYVVGENSPMLFKRNNHTAYTVVENSPMTFKYKVKLVTVGGNSALTFNIEDTDFVPTCGKFLKLLFHQHTWFLVKSGEKKSWYSYGILLM